MGVTDADGKLVGNLSLSDLRGLDQDHFGLLLLPVSEMIAILQGTKVSCAFGSTISWSQFLNQTLFAL